MKNFELLKPLLRFDCFFALIALVLIFAYFFIVTYWAPPESDISKIILGAMIPVFQQLANWAWRTTKASVDKRQEEAECNDVTT